MKGEDPHSELEATEPAAPATSVGADHAHGGAGPTPLVSRVLELITSAERALDALLAHEPAAGGASAPTTSSSATDLIHDYRVALRRLRSVLRPLEIGYGKRRMRGFADALREHAATTGDLRDEEVLRETLDDIDKGLDPRTRAALARWKAGRERRERGQRARIIRATRNDGALGAGVSTTLSALRKRLLKSRPDRVDDRALAEDALRSAFAKVSARLLAASPHEPESMHRLRIGMKQLRYTIELVRPDSPLDLEAAEALSVKLQKQLGKLHDLDEALLRMERARGLEPAARRAVLEELARVRHKLAARCDKEVRGPLRKLLAELGSSLDTPAPGAAR